MAHYGGQARLPGGRRALAVGGVGLSVAVLGTAGAVWRGGLTDDATAAESYRAPVRVVRAVESRGYQTQRVYTGQVEPRREARLAFELAGRVSQVMVDDGASVRAGQAIARLDTRRTEARVAQTRAELAAARSILDEMRAGERAEVVEQARSRCDELEARWRRAQLRADRLARLRVSGAINEIEQDEALYDAQAARAAHDAARHRLAELEAGARPETLAMQEARVDALAAAVASLEIDLRDATLRAPFDGRVMARRVDEGAVVEPGQPVLDLMETTQVEARIGLPEHVADAVSVGQTYEIRVGERRVKAVVRSVLPALDGATNTIQTVLTVCQPPDTPAPHPGRVVRLTVTDRVEAAGYWLPADCLTSGSDGLWSVLTVDPGRVVRRVPLEALHHDGDRVYVRGPLSPRDPIIVGQAGRIVPGQEVELVEPIVFR